MGYKLTFKCQINKRSKDKKCRSYIIYFLNGIEILKQKLPFDTDYELGCQHQTGIENVYLFNGKIYQNRYKDDKLRFVSFPISKSKLSVLGFPNDFKLDLENGI
jgi:hypothetical protein